MKYTWYLLPFTTLWAILALIHFTIFGSPLDTWYNIPLAVTYLLIFVVSFVVAIHKVEQLLRSN